jgi:ATP-dependent phosphoenolpyruvate carboxykinase
MKIGHSPTIRDIIARNAAQHAQQAAGEVRRCLQLEFTRTCGNYAAKKWRERGFQACHEIVGACPNHRQHVARIRALRWHRRYVQELQSILTELAGAA